MGKWAKVPKKQGVKQSEYSKQYGKAKDSPVLKTIRAKKK